LIELVVKIDGPTEASSQGKLPYMSSQVPPCHLDSWQNHYMSSSGIDAYVAVQGVRYVRRELIDQLLGPPRCLFVNVQTDERLSIGQRLAY